jgi:hypothetical protein
LQFFPAGIKFSGLAGFFGVAKLYLASLFTVKAKTGMM